MIRLLAGDNDFEIQREVDRLREVFDGHGELIDGTELEVRNLPDLLMGATLFSDKRLVLIKQLSKNKAVWDALPEWTTRMSDDTTLVLIEGKPDKRTRTYKALQKIADVSEYKAWTDRDVQMAERWAANEATRRGFTLDRQSAQVLIARTGVNQWRVYHAVDKLSLLKEVTPAVIERVIEKNQRDNVFQLFETALKGDTAKVQQMIETFRVTEEPYMVVGLLSSQVFQLAVLALSDESSDRVAKAIDAHPFVLSKLSGYAQRLGRGRARKVVAAFDEADAAMKSTAVDPWLLLERALVKVSLI